MTPHTWSNWIAVTAGIMLAQIASAQPSSLPSDSKDPQRGAFHIVLPENSPLSAVELQSQRYHIKPEPMQRYALGDESFEMYVPDDYSADSKPYGLLVWISAGGNGSVPRQWQRLLD